jgi:glycosyltransferase involved in cell wall biosynthesis
VRTLAKTPDVTVVVCAYNARPFITDTITSVLRQTWCDFDLVVVDDGSTDGTVEVLESIGDSRLRILRQRNGGAAVALNAGIEAGRGEYVAVLDHDDLWLPTKLARHVEFLEGHPEVDLTFSWSGLISETGKRLALHSQRHVGPVSFSELLTDFVIGPTSSVVMRRSVLASTGLCDPALARYYDMDLFLRIALVRPANSHAIPEELTLYRRHEGQLSSDWRAMQQDWARLLNKARALAPAATTALADVADANMHRYFAYLAYERREYGAALSVLRRAFRRGHPGSLADLRNLRVGVACLAGLVLPAAIHRRLEALARLR